MSILENPTIPIVIRWSLLDRSIKIENRRPRDTIRSDRLAHVERACEALSPHILSILQRCRCEAFNDRRVEQLAVEVRATCALVTRQFEVLFVVVIESDEDRALEEARLRMVNRIPVKFVDR